MAEVTVPETLEVTAEEDRDLVPVSAETAVVSEEQETEVSVSEPASKKRQVKQLQQRSNQK